MKVIFSQNAWEDYTSWIDQNKKMVNKINVLIKDIRRTPFEGLGKPEPLKYDLSGLWSRRIDQEHRLVYRTEGENIIIYSCRFHYDK
jgi:toxin YoeB